MAAQQLVDSWLPQPYFGPREIRLEGICYEVEDAGHYRDCGRARDQRLRLRRGL